MNQSTELSDYGIFEIGEPVKDGEYTITEFLGRGNSGEVYRIHNPRHGHNRALKLYVPFYELKQLPLGGEAQVELSGQVLERSKEQSYHTREYRFLSEIDHPFVVRVHDSGFQKLTSQQTERLSNVTNQPIDRTNLEFAIIVAGYVEGDTLSAGLKKLNRPGIIRVLRSLAEALDYIHTAHNILHLDIKSANVRVRPDGYPILLDFALSHDLSEDARSEGAMIHGGIDWDLTPFRIGTSSTAAFVHRVQTKGMTKQEFFETAFPAFDLFQLGLMLHDNRAAICRVLTPAEIAYFDILCAELIDSRAATNHAAGELFERIKRIDATQFYLAIRPGSMSGGKEIRLSSNRRVFVSPRLLPLVQHPELTRLNRLNQLSLLPAAFAGATHSRYEHSLDVFRLAQSSARRLLDQPECRRIFREQDVEVLMIAALLHDVNHVPMTHLYQEAGLAELEHEDLFSASFEQRYAGLPSLADVIRDSIGENAQRLHRIVEGDWKDQTSEADQIISSLINSGIDLDKLSYLLLDSERSGLGFAAGVDVNSLLDAMTVVQWRKTDDENIFVNEGFHIAFPYDCLPLVESVAMARTRAFKLLYWCDENRAMMARFLSCIRRLTTTVEGASQVAALVRNVRSETDYGVLQLLDALSNDLLGESPGLSGLFDSMAGSRATLVYSTSKDFDRLRGLAASERIAFEEKLATQLASHLSSLAEDSAQLILDVPNRPLDLGGEILILKENDGSAVTGTSISPILEAQQAELRRFSSRIRLFASGQLAEQWMSYVDSNGRDAADRLFGDAIQQSLGRSTLR